MRDMDNSSISQHFPGLDEAWRLLCRLDPEIVRRNAKATFDPSLQSYSLRSFSHKIYVSLEEKKLVANSADGDFILEKIGDLLELTTLWYLVSAKDVPLSGKLIKPASVRGGGIFLKGSHVLPLDDVAIQYESDSDRFLERGKRLGAEILEYGDASIRLYPFPRAPVVIILWEKDDEFSARADLLLKASCELHLPTDIIWATAMMSVSIML